MAVLQTPWYGRAMEALKLNGKGGSVKNLSLFFRQRP
jgi:hypothetical protein